jgi:siroheme synthase-like protein
MSSYYPIFLQLQGRACVVVGGGAVALRKVESLQDAGAKVRVIAPRLDESLQLMASEQMVEWVGRDYRKGDLDGACLVIAATDDRLTNEAVRNEAESLRIPVNVVDVPELCDFILPAVIDRGEVTIAFSTGGSSPALARRLRCMLEETIGPEYGQFARLLGELRPEVKQRISEQGRRAAFWQRLVESDIPELLRQGNMDAVQDKINAAFREETN